MITVVFGLPGAGKTTLLAAIASTFLNGSPVSQALFENTCREVEALNAEGFNYSLPRHAPVYTNFALNVRTGWNSTVGSFYIDGFHMGFPNKYVPVFNVFPGSKIFLSEAQRYYNSRKSSDFPEWVSRYFEEHRHFGLDIWLDLQRAGLIDINIRDIVELFIQVLSVRLQRCEAAVDRHWQAVFEVVNYNSYSEVEAGKGEPATMTFDFNPFECFESQSYYRSFLPSVGNLETIDEDKLEKFVKQLLPPGDFHQLDHVNTADPKVDLMLKQFLYRQTAPRNFRVKEDNRIKNNQTMRRQSA